MQDTPDPRMVRTDLGSPHRRRVCLPRLPWSLRLVSVSDPRSSPCSEEGEAPRVGCAVGGGASACRLRDQSSARSTCTYAITLLVYVRGCSLKSIDGENATGMITDVYPLPPRENCLGLSPGIHQNIIKHDLVLV
jgi:hypothetical protein